MCPCCKATLDTPFIYYGGFQDHVYAHGTPKWIVQGWSLFFWGPHLEHFLHDEPMLEGTVPLGTHREDWYVAIWKTVVIMIVGLLQRRRLATSGNNSLEAKNYSLPWLKLEAVFPSLDPRTVWNIWTSWGTKLDRTSRPRKPPFFEGLPGASAGFPLKQAFLCRHLSVCTERWVAPRSVAQPEVASKMMTAGFHRFSEVIFYCWISKFIEFSVLKKWSGQKRLKFS